LIEEWRNGVIEVDSGGGNRIIEDGRKGGAVVSLISWNPVIIN